MSFHLNWNFNYLVHNYPIDDDDNNSSNWTKVKDEHHEEVVLSNSQEMDKSDDKYSQINMQQGYRRDNA